MTRERKMIKIFQMFETLYGLCTCMVGTAAAFILLYWDLGWPALAGLAVMVGLSLLQLTLAIKCGHLR